MTPKPLKLSQEIREILEEYALRVESGEYNDDDERLCLKCLLAITNQTLFSILKAVGEREKPLLEALTRLCGFCGNEAFDRAVKQGHQAIAQIREELGITSN